ncbi:5-oxoprolinase subunit PxpB [Deinococcus sp. Arct2-2]|uniref:5-oxoprolinase subunit PxpB n=1 Tax=Deinococcus sp. Arct2-2 TaxID=2568653 RepID=UPI0010A4A6E3|nr:5-oxoprolinase subunit PxpB [Deinococcus sp. Arct2-2]THF69692.1 5-oxoprolinase subunit PxpB [Deinococcus sp. Arct2-2]
MQRLKGFYVQFCTELDRRQNVRLHALHRRLQQDLIEGITDLYPGYVNLYVEFDAAVLDRETVRGWVTHHLKAMPERELTTDVPGRSLEIPVRYDGEDLEEVAAHTGLSAAEVVRLHSAPAYHVYAVGFTPGFPFLGEVTPSLRLPRRSTPRAGVPFNAVAIAAAQSCVYVLPSPGGWHLLGTALTTIYDPNRPQPFLISPGDSVRFVPAYGASPPLPEVRPLWPAASHHPALRVVKPGLLDVLVDAGRFRQAHYGLARSGPLDARSADLANRLAGNLPGTPLLELTLLGPKLLALQDVTLAVAGYGMVPRVNGQATAAQARFLLRAGQTLDFKPTDQGARSYLAVAGGLETQPFLGSSSVDRTGRIGRPLQAGDVLGLSGSGVGDVRTLPPGRIEALSSPPPPSLPSEATLRLLPGPQASFAALVALASAPFRVSSGDRMGIRLSGPEVPGGQVISEATPHGAVQVTPAGQPILLLADRGRIGGYHKPAVIHPEDLPLAAQLRPNQLVHLRPYVSGPPETWAQRWFLQA